MNRWQEIPREASTERSQGIAVESKLNPVDINIEGAGRVAVLSYLASDTCHVAP